MDLKNIHESKTVRGVLAGIAITVVALVIFQAGQATGFRKARFAGNFGNNFERNFLGPRGGGMDMLFNGDMPSGHGAVGEIVSLNLPQIVVMGPDNMEKIVMVGSTTQIHRFREETKADNLKVGDFIVVLGSPNDNGQIEAKLIRIMPARNTSQGESSGPEPNKEFTRMMRR